MQIMKQKGLMRWGCVFLIMGAAVLSAVAADNGYIQMVTYFPVPYAHYNKLNVTKKLDIGLNNNNSFTLKLGGVGLAAPENEDLNIDLQSNTLTMATRFVTPTPASGNNTVQFGNDGNGIDELIVDDLYLENIEHIKLIRRELTTRVDKFIIFGLTFPATGCDAPKKVKWKHLSKVALNLGTDCALCKWRLVCE